MERYRLRWGALVVVVLAVLVDMVDNQIVTVALPTIERDLDTGASALQWVSAGYALGFALTLITGGRLGDRYGRKPMFLLGMAIFTIASLVAGTAPHVGVLIVARVVQGLGSGLMVPQVLSFIHAEFDTEERPKAMAIYAAAFPLGGMAGPLLGGALTQADLFGTSWRAIFLVNLPIGILAIVGAAATMPARPATARERLDPGGLALLTIALFAIFYPLVQGRELGWPVWVIGLMVAAIPLLALFANQQRARGRRGGDPLIVPTLLRYRSLVAGQFVMLTVNTAVGVFFVLTLHLQLGLEYSPLETAFTFLPATLGIVVGNVVAVNLAMRIGRVFTAGSIVVLLMSLATIALLVVWQDRALDRWALLLPAIGFGLGMGAVLNALINTSMADVAPAEAGSASGVVNTTIQLGTATGIALFGTIFFSRLGSGSTTATATAIAAAVGVLLIGLALTAALPRKVPADSEAASRSGADAG